MNRLPTKLSAPSPKFPQARESAADPFFEDASREETRQLLGSLAPTFFRDERGALDFEKIPAKTFAEFREWLSYQAGVQDGKSFRNPYRNLILDERFDPLFRSIFEKRSQRGGDSGECLKRLAAEFKASFIGIDADRYVENRFSSVSGRNEIRKSLSEARHFSKDLVADLAKAIARRSEQDKTVSEIESHWVTKQISLWNYWNLGVSELELERAVEGAVDILKSTDLYFEQIQKDQKKETESPEYLSSLISPSEFHFFQGYVTEHHNSAHSVEGLKSHLANTILSLSNNRLWAGAEVPEGSLDMRRKAISQLQALFAEADKVNSSEELARFNATLRNKLDGSLGNEELGDKIFHWIRGNGWKQLFQNLPTESRQAYESLRSLSDSWHYAVDMGETLVFDSNHDQTSSRLLDQLQSAKLQLWQQYKQHKALSRALSQGGSRLFHAGDIEDIRKATRYFDTWIERIQDHSKDPTLAAALRDSLYLEFKEGGILAKAFEAAEVDGGEQILNLAQTCIELAAIAAVTEGLGAAGEAAEALNGLQKVSKAEALVQSASLGFQRGAAMSVSENALSVASGEARQGPETLESWVKDAMATGTSMALSQGLQGSLLTQEAAPGGLFQNILQRYANQGLKSAKHLASDASVEFGEESVDQYFRQVLDGKTQALTGHELQEIFFLTLGGGVLQQGYQTALLQGVNRSNLPSPAKNSQSKNLGIYEGLQAVAPQWSSSAAMLTLLVPDPSATHQQSGVWPILSAIFSVGVLTAGLFNNSRQRPSKSGPQSQALLYFRQYLQQDPKLQEELALGHVSEEQLTPFVDKLEENRNIIDSSSSRQIPLKFLAKGLRRMRRLSWPPESTIRVFTHLLEAWIHEGARDIKNFNEIATDIPKLHRKLRKFGWSEVKIRQTITTLSSFIETPLSINFWILRELAHRIRYWPTIIATNLIETLTKEPRSLYPIAEPLIHYLKFSRDNFLPEPQQLYFMEKLKIFGADLSERILCLSEHCARLQEMELPKGEDISRYLEPYIDLLNHLLEKLPPEEVRVALFKYRFTTQKAAAVVPAQIHFLRDFLIRHREGHQMLDELTLAREDSAIPEDPEQLDRTAREIDAFIETTGSFVNEAFKNYRISNLQEDGHHFFLIQEKASLASGDPREIRVLAPYINDPKYFPCLWRYLDLEHSPRFAARNQSQGDFVALKGEVLLRLIEDPSDSTALELAEIIEAHEQSLDHASDSSPNKALLAFGGGLATFFGSSIAEAALNAHPIAHATSNWHQIGAWGIAIATVLLGATITWKKGGAKIFEELSERGKELFSNFVDDYPKALHSLIKSGMSPKDFMEYFRLHDQRLKDYKTPVVGTYSGLILPNKALEAFETLPWSSLQKRELLLTALNAFLDSRQENPKNLAELFPQIEKFHLALAKLGWSESRKYRFILNVVKNSEDYSARALESIKSFIDNKLPLWGQRQTSRFIESLARVAKEQYGLFDILSGLMQDWTDSHIAQEVQRDRIYRLLETCGPELLAALEVMVQQNSKHLTAKSLPLVLEILTTRPETEKFYSGLHHYLVEIDNMPETDQLAHLEFLRDLNRDFPLGASIENLAEARKTSPRLIPNGAADLASIIPYIREQYQSTGTFDLRIYPNYRVERIVENGQHFFLIQERDGSQEDPKELKVMAPFLQDPEYFKLILDHLDLGRSRALRPRSEQGGDFYPIDPGIDLLLLENPGSPTIRNLAQKLYRHHRALDPNYTGVDSGLFENNPK